MDDWDVAIVGGGILGTSIAYWVASRYDGRIAVLEREARVGEHASRRNTGVVHRPFYLHPTRARTFARASQVSYGLWKRYAAERKLPWSAVGTLKVARVEEEVKALEENLQFAAANGMDPKEVELLDGRDVAKLEPNVACAAALHAKTDTVVDYGALTEAVRADAEALGVRFLTHFPVDAVEANPYGVVLMAGAYRPWVRTRFLLNCAGGEAVRLAHEAGVATEYADLHFRGDYWIVGAEAGGLVGRNVYTVPRHPDLPFLDPHWVVRVDGRREIGPNAVPVPGPYAYEGLFRHAPGWAARAFEPPAGNKLRFALSRTFLTLSAREMVSALSRGEMSRRVQRFIPRLREGDLVARGFAGIRANVVDRRGGLVKEAIEVAGPRSYHILNYNSPGATGAPAYGAYLVDRLAARGDLDHLGKNTKSRSPWTWESVAGPMGLAS
ncbi:MAG: FAD-dependent oxidoreductase [Euryarchaeota archaeon]|nr:FAD-dependent oxidoreductase [Euryarchaeota archaeon]